MTYDNVIGYCTAPATCSNGLLDVASDVCYQSASLSCPTGTSNVGGQCVVSPTCQGTGAFSSAQNLCTAAGSLSCNPGYTLDVPLSKCTQAPVCGAGTLNTALDICQATPTLTCLSGMTLVGGVCQATPGCPSGGSLNIPSGVCIATAGACGTGYTLDIVADKCYTNGTCSGGQTLAGSVCTSAASCDAGGALNVPLALCTGTGAYVCPASYTYSAAAGTCTTAVDCGSGSLGSTGVCEMITTTTCPGGYALNGSVCQASPVCDAGSAYSSVSKMCQAGAGPCASGSVLDSSADVCFGAAACPGSMNLAGGVCTANAVCDPGGSIDLALSMCRAPATFNCPGTLQYSPTSGQCFVAPSCSPGSLDTSLDVCGMPNTYSCDPGFTLNGTICQMAPVCGPGGSLNTTYHVCDAGGSACNPSWTLDTIKDTCYQAPTCPGTGGVFDQSVGKCWVSGTASCNSPYSLDQATGMCVVDPTCSPGIYDPATRTCTKAVTQDCGTYTLDAATGICSVAVTCPQDPTFSLASSIGFASSINKCASEAEHRCTPTYAYNGLPVEMCEAVPICTRGIFNPADNSCSTGSGNCPIGDYPCMSIKADTQVNPATGQKYLYCSPNSCTDNTQGMITTDDTTTGADDALNDGEVDANGNCLSTIYIFPGKTPVLQMGLTFCTHTFPCNTLPVGHVYAGVPERAANVADATTLCEVKL